MKLNIDFYAQNDISINLDFTDRYPYPEKDTGELLIFTCFLLNQLHVLGNEIEGFVMSGILVSEDELNNLSAATPNSLSAKVLLSKAKIYAFSLNMADKSKSQQEFLISQQSIINKIDRFDDSLLKLFDEKYFASLPRFVNPKGNGDKYFHATYPPYRMKTKYGFLGLWAGYYNFHSVLGVLRFIRNKHHENKVFLDLVRKICLYGGTAAIFGRTSADPVPAANAIIKELGLI